MQIKIPLCLGLTLCASVAHAQTYHLTPLGDNSAVSAINDLGQIVGTDDYSTSGAQLTDPVAYLWSGGKSTLLGHNIQSANDINNLGQITGALSVDSRTHAYLYSGGHISDLDPNGNTGAGSAGYAINNHGVVAGSYSPSDYSLQTAAATFANGRINDLGVTPATPGFSYATAINDKGQVAAEGGYDCGGRHCGFLNTGGKNTVIPALGGHFETFANGINNAGTVVGTSEVTTSDFGFPRHAISFSNGTVTDLTPGQTGNDESFAYAINNAGAIVGSDVDGAFIYTGGKARNLNTMLDSSGKGWTLSSAVDINNLGQIVGVGTDAQGLSRAFVLAPVPEPGTWATMLAGLAVMGSVVRRRKRGAAGPLN